MEKVSSRLIIGVITAITLIFALIGINAHSVHAAQATINLGSAAPFAILAGTPNITDAGNLSVITGNVGLSPASGAGIGLLCPQVTGTIYSVDAGGPVLCRVTNGPLMVNAKNSLTAAYLDAAGRTPLTTVPTELGGTTLTPGVYDSTSTRFGITSGAGPLTLNGQNDTSSVFIFQAPFSGTGLTVGSASNIILTNGARACNIFWRVDTASIGTTANFIGNVLALNSITVANGATIEGRLLAQNGNVTLINDTITISTCAGNDTVETPTPGFPNTGSIISNSLFVIIPSIIILAIVSLALIARKKRLL